MFCEGLHTKLKMAIFGLPQRTIAKIQNSTRMIEDKLLPIKKAIVKQQEKSNDEEFEKDLKDEGYKKTKKKRNKVHVDTYQRGVYYLNCYNERHYEHQGVQVIVEVLPICKNDDHNIHQCPKNISKKQC